MNLLDYIFLLLTGLLALYLIWKLISNKDCEEKPCPCRYYFVVAFLVLLVAGLILIFAGWEALGWPFVSVVAGLIPFSLATGLIVRFHRGIHIPYLALMILGLVLIAVGKFGDFTGFAKVIYPIFHGIAGLTIVIVPIVAVSSGKAPGGFIFFAIGGALIGLGGMALTFLSGGNRLLFFSQEVVLAILAPLLFLTTLGFALGMMSMSQAIEEAEAENV